MPSFEEQKGKGRVKGSLNKATLYRRALADLLPGAKERLADAIDAGELGALSLLFDLTLSPLKTDFPLYPFDLHKPPGQVAADIRSLVATGAIGISHANAVADLVLKLQRMETCQAVLDAQIVETTPLEAATQVVSAAASTGDLTTLETALTHALPYTTPRPQPEPPQPTGTVSAIPLGLEGDDWMNEYSNPDAREDGAGE